MTQTTRLTDEQLETLIEVVFIVAMADGALGDGEVARFRARAAQLEDGRFDSERLDGLMLEAALRLQKEGRDARLAHARTVLADRDARRIALALAVEIARADGLEEPERESARAVGDALGVDRAEVDALLAR
jgi:tellurite resistance protein